MGYVLSDPYDQNNRQNNTKTSSLSDPFDPPQSYKRSIHMHVNKKLQTHVVNDMIRPDSKGK